MENDDQKSGEREQVARFGKSNNGRIPHSFKALSRIVSSGALTVASTVKSAASAIVERDGETNRDQVSWAGFDKLELEKGLGRQVLLLGFNHGFQVWDVEVADNVCNLASRRDSPVSFMQMLPIPLTSTLYEDKFAHIRPLVVICAVGSSSEDGRSQEGPVILRNGSINQCNGSVNGIHVPAAVFFYSLKAQSYVHVLKLRSVVHLVRCSSRVVCVLQSAQIHCLNAVSLEREYTILTNPVTLGCSGFGNIGVGPLAVGPRWMAYSGPRVVTSNSSRVTPQDLTPFSSPAAVSNGSLVAHFAKESSKQLAAGIVTLGDMGYKKLSRYYSDLLPDGKNVQGGNILSKIQGVSGGHSMDVDGVGMVIVRDIVHKTVIAQFRAHKSPISALCFDPSGTLLVTASIQGHNINVFRIMPGVDSEASSGQYYSHLYRLQRGFTNAVIQDISFSNDSQWIMISSSRGTSHLFAISPFGGTVKFQSPDMAKAATGGILNSGLQLLAPQNICEPGLPITLSAVSRIRNGNSGWKNAMSGAAAAATGRLSSISGVIASAFHKCKGNELQCSNTLKKNYHLLVFSPSGSVIQYVLRFSSPSDGVTPSPGICIAAADPSLSHDARLMVEAIQKWNICQKLNGKDEGASMDFYGEHGTSDSNKVHPENRTTTEEKHHMYISEAELHMHQNTNPLWLKSEICFQLMQADDFDREEDSSVGGEIEIEKIPVYELEARPIDLIPVYTYPQTPIFEHRRVTPRSCSHKEHSQSLTSKLSHESRSSSLDTTANLYVGNASENDGPNAPHLTESNGGSVNTSNDNYSPGMEEIQLENVNNRETP